MSPHNIRGIRALVEAMPGMTVDKVSHLLYDASGLLGVSGISAYMEVLLSSADARAAEAVRHFVYGCMRTIGSLAAALGGLDAISMAARSEVRAERAVRMLSGIGCRPRIFSNVVFSSLDAAGRVRRVLLTEHNDYNDGKVAEALADSGRERV